MKVAELIKRLEGFCPTWDVKIKGEHSYCEDCGAIHSEDVNATANVSSVNNEHIVFIEEEV